MPQPNKTTAVQPEPETKPVTMPAFKFVDGPHYQSFYCNNVGFAINPLDVVLYLNEIIEVTSTGEAIVERKARVTMNPVQVKAFMHILDHIVKLYELQNGPLRDLPTGFESASS